MTIEYYYRAYNKRILYIGINVSDLIALLESTANNLLKFRVNYNKSET